MKRIRQAARPYGLNKTPFDPRTGGYLPLVDQGVVAVYTLVEEGHDALVVTDRDGVRALIAKPTRLRRSVYDGVTFTVPNVGDVTYTHAETLLAVGERSATDGSTTEVQLITPSYCVGDVLLALKRHEWDRIAAEVWGELTDYDVSDEYVLDWEDTGFGREWAVV